MLKRLFVVFAAIGMLAVATGASRAQVDFPTSQSGINSRGGTVMCLDASNVSQPSSATNPCPVTIQSGTLTSSGYSATVTLTRTNDAAPYAANDVVGAATGSTAALTFPSMGPSKSSSPAFACKSTIRPSSAGRRVTISKPIASPRRARLATTSRSIFRPATVPRTSTPSRSAHPSTKEAHSNCAAIF